MKGVIDKRCRSDRFRAGVFHSVKALRNAESSSAAGAVAHVARYQTGGAVAAFDTAEPRVAAGDAASGSSRAIRAARRNNGRVIAAGGASTQHRGGFANVCRFWLLIAFLLRI